MSKALDHGVWLAICDGRKAILAENQGDALFPKLEMRAVYEHEVVANHLQGSDRPGRVLDSSGRRAAVSEPDFQLHAEEKFLHNFAKAVTRQIQHNNIRAMILIAPPRPLGILPKALSPAARNAVVGEACRDYVKLPGDYILELSDHKS